MTREDAKKYIKDKYKCDVITLVGVELVPLYQVVDRLEQPVPALDRIKEAREEVNNMGGDIETIADCLQILDKLIAESEG